MAFDEVLSMLGIIGLGIAAVAVFLTRTVSNRQPQEVETPTACRGCRKCTGNLHRVM